MLNYYFRLLLVTGLFTITSTVQARGGTIETSENGSRNYCIVHTDKSFYVTGEVIWFKVYLPETLQYQRSLARVDLIDRDQEVLHTQYVKVNKQNNSNGYYLIPYGFKPDIYYLTVTVFNEDGNFPLNLVYHPVAIYNDLIKLDTTVTDFVDPGGAIPQNISANQNANLKVQVAKPTYQPRQEVTLTIKVTDKQGNPVQTNLSVSVVDDVLVNNHPKNLSNFTRGPDVGQSFLVDNEIAFRGIVKTSADNSVYETDYLGALIREEGLLRLFESYDDGTFEIDLPYFEGPRQMQLLGYFEPDLYMTLDKTIYSSGDLQPLELVYTKEILEYLELSRQRKKINQLFDQLAFQGLPGPRPPENKLEPDRSLDLSVFEPFESMEGFFKQVVTPLKIKKLKDGSYDIKMVNPENKPFYKGVPRFMIDGRFINDPEVAVTMDMKSISRIDLFYFASNLRRQFDQFGNSGIAAIYTKEGTFLENGAGQPNIFDVHGGVPAADFQGVSGIATDPEQNTPVFNPVIYWDPSVNTDENGEASISFFHSDDRGKFRVEAMGDGGNGVIVIEKTGYQIK